MGKIRILGIAIIWALLLGLGTSVAALGETPVSINAPDRVMPGSDFTATVDIGEVVELNAAQYDVSFDNTVLQLDDITSGQIDSTEIPVLMFNEISPGTYTVVQCLFLDAVSGSGYLSVLHFHVIGSPGDSSLIDLSNGLLSGWEAEIPATWVGDSVRVAVDITAISVAPSSINFGSIKPGNAVSGDDINVTNIGTVAVDVSASLDKSGTVFEYLKLGGASPPSSWTGISGLAGGTTADPVTTLLDVPRDYSAKGVETNTLVFTARASP